MIPEVAITLLLSGHSCRGLNQPSEECSWVWVVVCLWLLAVDHRLQTTPVVSQRSEEGLRPQVSTTLLPTLLPSCSGGWIVLDTWRLLACWKGGWGLSPWSRLRLRQSPVSLGLGDGPFSVILPCLPVAVELCLISLAGLLGERFLPFPQQLETSNGPGLGLFPDSLTGQNGFL